MSPASRPKVLRFMARMVLSRTNSAGSRGRRSSGSLESSAVRQPAVIAAAVALGAIVLAGCGSEGVVAPTPSHGGRHAAAGRARVPIVPAFNLKGDPAAGKAIFLEAGCGGCHTLAAAHSTGTVGPNLDQREADLPLVTARVTLGKRRDAVLQGPRSPTSRSPTSPRTS